MATKVLRSNLIYPGYADFVDLKKKLMFAIDNSVLLKDIIRDKYWDFNGLQKQQYNTNTAQIVKDKLKSIYQSIAANRESFPFYNKEHVENFIYQVIELCKNKKMRDFSPIREIFKGINDSKSVIASISEDAHKIIEDFDKTVNTSAFRSRIFSRLSRFNPYSRYSN
jgi:hypothetical protein|uniref:Uncharacterized protein n=1 Tax=viral metagenome TaxID=1070528 RepID=A0A6C0JUK2_9ZZZZ